MSSAMPTLFLRQSEPPAQPTQAYLDESNVASILGITGAFSCAALLVVALRVWVRSHMLHYVGPDDWAMFAASLMAIGSFICLCGESQLGMGRHQEWQQQWMLRPYFQWLFAHGMIVMWGVVLVKISIAFFLMRIMLQKPWKIFLWFSIACTGTLVFACTPVSANWDFVERMKPTTHCYSGQTYGFIGLFNSIINIITDVLFAIIPIPIILKLQVNKRTKISLIVVLSLGFFACIAGILKARLQVHVLDTPDQGFENRFQIWYMLELCLGILAASLPTLKPLFAAVLNGTRSRLGERSRSRGTAGRYAGISGSRVSHLRPQNGPISFPEPMGGIDLKHYKKSSGGTVTTVVESDSVAGSSDADVGKSLYDVRVTGGPEAEDGEQWESGTPRRCGSQERLHYPTSGIYKRVEMTHTTEVTK